MRCCDQVSEDGIARIGLGYGSSSMNDRRNALGEVDYGDLMTFINAEGSTSPAQCKTRAN